MDTTKPLDPINPLFLPAPARHLRSWLGETLFLNRRVFCWAEFSPVRAKLINKRMIYSPAHGDMDFTVPLFDDFMIRTILTFKR